MLSDFVSRRLRPELRSRHTQPKQHYREMQRRGRYCQTKRAIGTSCGSSRGLHRERDCKVMLRRGNGGDVNATPRVRQAHQRLQEVHDGQQSAPYEYSIPRWHGQEY